MARFLWTQVEDIGPSPSMGHAMAFVIRRNRTVLFGGDALGGTMLDPLIVLAGTPGASESFLAPHPSEPIVVLATTGPDRPAVSATLTIA